MQFMVLQAVVSLLFPDPVRKERPCILFGTIVQTKSALGSHF